MANKFKSIEIWFTDGCHMWKYKYSFQMIILQHFDMCNTKMSFYIEIISRATFLKTVQKYFAAHKVNEQHTYKKTRPQRWPYSVRILKKTFVILIHFHFVLCFVFLFHVFTYPWTELIFKCGIRIIFTVCAGELTCGNCFVCLVHCTQFHSITHIIVLSWKFYFYWCHHLLCSNF